MPLGCSCLEKTGDVFYGRPPMLTIHLANHLSMKEPLVSERLPCVKSWGNTIFDVDFLF